MPCPVERFLEPPDEAMRAAARRWATSEGSPLHVVGNEIALPFSVASHKKLCEEIDRVVLRERLRGNFRDVAKELRPLREWTRRREERVVAARAIYSDVSRAVRRGMPAQDVLWITALACHEVDQGK